MGARDLSDMYARGPQARGLRAYTSGESRTPMLQVICITSGTLKICPNLQAFALPIYITISSLFVLIMAFLLDIAMTFIYSMH